tara:strand:- start:70 stop:567 length:498 start_codon:yes stop_codon:yes gene_type:complete
MTRNDNMLKYKNIYNQRHGESNNQKTENLTEKDLDNFLEKEKTKYENEPWNKLNKTDKIKKLYDFANNYVNENSITEEKITMEKFLKSSLENKKISKIKDIKYDKSSGKIIEIIGLKYDKTANRFMILKSNDNHVSTSKQLGTPKKSKTTNLKKTFKKSPKKNDK